MVGNPVRSGERGLTLRATRSRGEIVSATPNPSRRLIIENCL